MPVLLHPLEHGQDVLPRPTSGPVCLSPFIVIAWATTNIQHAIDAARATQHFAARNFGNGLSLACAWNTFQAPIEAAIAHHTDKAQWRLNQWMAVATPRLYKQNFFFWVTLCQNAGNNGTGASTANDNCVPILGDGHLASGAGGSFSPRSKASQPSPLNKSTPNCAAT